MEIQTISEYQGKPLNLYKTGNGINTILLPDFWGRTQSVLNLADRLGHAGLCVHVLDYYQGSVAQSEIEAQHLMWLTDMTAVTEIFIKQALRHTGPSHLIGLGFGGSLALVAQSKLDNIKSVVSCMGLPPAPAVKKVQVPFLFVNAIKSIIPRKDAAEKFIKMAPKGKISNQLVDDNFLNETSSSFDFNRMRSTAELVSNFVKETN